MPKVLVDADGALAFPFVVLLSEGLRMAVPVVHACRLCCCGWWAVLKTGEGKGWCGGRGKVFGGVWGTIPAERVNGEASPREEGGERWPKVVKEGQGAQEV